MSDQIAMEILAKQLTEAMELNHRLTESLQHELLQNREIRTELRANLNALQNTVNEIKQITHGDTGTDPLAVVIDRLETATAILAKRIDAIEQRQEKATEHEQETRKIWMDRAWEVLVTNSPSLLAVIGMLILWLWSK